MEILTSVCFTEIIELSVIANMVRTVLVIFGWLVLCIQGNSKSNLFLILGKNLRLKAVTGKACSIGLNPIHIGLFEGA